MLHVSRALKKPAVIATYNRALADECNARIQKLGLSGLIKCYTFHGLVAKSAGRSCRNDTELLQILAEWDQGTAQPLWRLPCSIVMLDEVQDLRPSFANALNVILSNAATSDSLQLLVVGDSDQLLYDFETYGADKASPRYLQNAEVEFGCFTTGRSWTRLKLNTSYRLTQNTAGVVNAIWGTSISGGNAGSPNVPVQYRCVYPYPSTRLSSEQYLATDELAAIITEHGPENVMLLANSLKSDKYAHLFTCSLNVCQSLSLCPTCPA